MYKLFLFILGITIFLMLFTYQEGFEIPSSVSMPSSTSMPSSIPSKPLPGSSTLPGISPKPPPIGKYDYLAPPPPDIWNQDIINKFVNKWNSNLGNGNDNYMLDASAFTKSGAGKKIYENVLEEEAVYYINNGRWPINTYVSDYLDANPTAIPDNFKLENGTRITRNNISQYFSSRVIYAMIIYIKEYQITPPPESILIFSGQKPPPLPSQSSTSLSNSEIEQLKSICKKF